ncbi:polycystic kidney disease 2-like 1 protein [Teleopsis dalmanni]|uniref:polycystic kidney disease 2-like 1 protein n=1 Tax=Teleopsis dalmanni TaxID=139649 RepID=UPI0018CEC919|nr:polycystic kidney disease 2-like 1 protein [Teleopsis dalmanni]
MILNRFQKVCINITIAIIILGIVIILLTSNFKHENEKLKTVLIAIALVWLIKYVIFDLLILVALAFSDVYCKCYKKLKRTRQEDKPQQNGHIETLKLQVESYKSKVQLPEKHTHETTNLKYKQITADLWVYGKQFLLLLIVIMGIHNGLTYWNAVIMRRVLTKNEERDYSLNDVKTPDQIYEFIRNLPILQFNDGKDYNNMEIKEQGWISYELGKLIGVVRLRQFRRTSEKDIIRNLVYEFRHFMPGWQLPYEKLHYVDKFWRITEPWLPMEATSFQTHNDFFAFTRSGVLDDYDDGGYVAVLARDVNNSENVVQMLEEFNWINEKTLVVFIEFTVYNTDTNIFTVSSIMMEQTPFGIIMSSCSVLSSALLLNIDQLSYIGLIVLLLYILQLIEFTTVIFLRIWHAPETIWLPWNLVDITIVALNLIVVALIVCREALLEKLMDYVYEAEKLHYIDFRVPAEIDYITLFALGLLVALTTIRLWKILQFAKVFNAFTTTLFEAKYALISTTLLIFLFIFAFSITSLIINGNNVESFHRFFKSFSCSISIAVGFKSDGNLSDVEHDSQFLGIILYIILVFAVSIVLINLFITLSLSYFSTIKASRSMEIDVDLSFFEYLRMEYKSCCQRCKCCRTKAQKTKSQMTVKEDVERQIEEHEKLNKGEKDDNSEEADKPSETIKQTEENIEKQAMEKYVDEINKIERLREIARILTLQTELLSRVLNEVDSDFETDDENENEGHSKNGKIIELRIFICLIKLKENCEFDYNYPQKQLFWILNLTNSAINIYS